MKFYISTTGIKKVTISNSSGGGSKGAMVAPAARGRLASRTLLPVVLVLGIVLPFLFVRVAFLVLESASSSCSSPFGNFLVHSNPILTESLPFFFLEKNNFCSMAAALL